MSSDLRVEIPNSSSSHFEEVVKLADKNRKPLGFLPEGALREYADKGNILAAID